MKKSLLAVAVAAALPALAQAQVTLYGKIDVSVAAIDRGGSASNMTMVQTGMGQTSRLGVRGLEKMSGGLSAVFQIEGGLEMDTGAAALNFTRESWGGLQGGFGEVRLGRTLTPSFHADALGDIMGYSFFGGQGNWSSNGGGGCSAVSGSTNAGSAPPATTSAALNTALANAGSTQPWSCQGTSPGGYDTRYSNAVLWISPSMSGLTLRAMYSFGERDSTVGTGVVSSTSSGSGSGIPGVGSAVLKDSGNAFDISGIYTAGPLGLAVALQDGKGGNNAASRKVTTLAGSYSLGNITVKGGWAQSDSSARLGSGKMELEKTNLGISYKVGVGSVMLAYTMFDGKNFSTSGDTREANVLGLAYTHPLSKNTMLYASYGKTDNKTATSAYGLYAGAPNFSPASAGVDMSGMIAGIIHNF